MKSVSVDLPSLRTNATARESFQPAALRPSRAAAGACAAAVLVCCAASVLCAVVSFSRLQSRLAKAGSSHASRARSAQRGQPQRARGGRKRGEGAGTGGQAGWRAEADKRAGRARWPRTVAQSGCAGHVRDGARKARSRAGAGARKARREGEEQGVERRWQRRVRCSEDFSGGGRLKQRSGRH